MGRRVSDDDIARIRAAVAPVVAAPEPVSWLEKATHRRIVVHTTDDQSIEGVLTLTAEDGLVLWSAKILLPSGIDGRQRDRELAGEVFIPRDKVLLVQTVRM